MKDYMQPYFGIAGVTRHTLLPTSSATSSAPARSTATPTGRPSASPCALTKPVSISSGVSLPGVRRRTAQKSLYNHYGVDGSMSHADR